MAALNARRPTFLIAGVPKSGTTSLYHYLSQHPQIFMSPIKEPTFFAAADLLHNETFRRRQARERDQLLAYLAGPQEPGAQLYVTGWEEYLQLFRNASHQVAIGEASGGYFWLPSAAAAIRARLPDARLVFILRDPAERLFSWYVLSLRDHPGRTFRAWFEHEETRTDWWSAADGGRYATHLERFLKLFPRSQLRIHLYDDYRRDTAAVLRDVLEFVGVDASCPIDTTQRHNETVVPRFPRLHRLKTLLFGDHSPGRWVPSGLRRTLRRVYHHGRGSFMLAPEDRRMVIEYYREEIRRTADLIGRDLSGWLR